MNTFLLAFIPLFVAFDAVGVLPLYVSFTEHLTKRDRRRVLLQSVITAFIIGILFLFLGKWIFKVLGIYVSDFKIAGGLVLLVISLRDLLQYERPQKISAETVGAVPIGIPLITGPAVLTTIIILLDLYGPILTVTSFIVNLGIVWMTFHFSAQLSRFLGKPGSKAFSKIANILLAVIAVMMIRKGIVDTCTVYMQVKGL